MLVQFVMDSTAKIEWYLRFCLNVLYFPAIWYIGGLKGIAA